jgi:glycosyltransferase involved in cell wall biosynthesis
MSRTFVTIFPICENVHLTKDLGQIPYFLHKKYGYDSKIVSYKNSQEYSNLENEVKGLKLEFLENKGRWRFVEKAVVDYLRENAKKIDVLNLYLFSKHSFVYGLVYKRYNPSGKVFLKLDGYNDTFAPGTSISHSVNPFKNIFFRYLEKKFLKKVNLISIENSEGESLVKSKFPLHSEKVFYLPVGVNDLFLKEMFEGRTRNFDEKENIILTVGRIGESIKNNEMMLNAFALLKSEDWKLVMVGKVNPGFHKFIDDYFLTHPHLKEKIEFTDEIRDRKKLYEWYNRSKIFCMTSIRESFCHSIAEALYFGNYVVGTEGIMSMKDITLEGKLGAIVANNDHKALAQKLQDLMDNENILKETFPKIIEHSRKNFSWSKIIDLVHHKISNN